VAKWTIVVIDCKRTVYVDFLYKKEKEKKNKRKKRKEKKKEKKERGEARWWRPSK